jgi:hypothetical protein
MGVMASLNVIAIFLLMPFLLMLFNISTIEKRRESACLKHDQHPKFKYKVKYLVKQKALEIPRLFSCNLYCTDDR